MARKQMVSPPGEGAEAPEFNLPGAQGGQLRLHLRTVRGPVIVVFYRGAWSEECVEYFKRLAEKEREINVAGATLAGIGPVEPDEAREFVRATGIGSYVLYDYLRKTTGEYGLLEKDAEHGDTARPAVFLIGTDHQILRAWLDDRPAPEDLLSEVSRITGLPKEPEEGEEKPKKRPKKSAGEEKEAGTGAESAAEPGKNARGDGEDNSSGEATKSESAEAEEKPEATASAGKDSEVSEPREAGTQDAETGAENTAAGEGEETQPEGPAPEEGEGDEKRPPGE